jgi:acetoin utilization protein AcuC
MEAGLAPGMVRKGLRLMGDFVECLEVFMVSLELKTVTIGAFYYHNAILWERYGFTYFKGGKMMEKIHREFQPGGSLYERLDDSTPFRRKGMEQSIRGRSWAIHDGVFVDVFDEEWESPIMYKILGKDFKVNTFPGQIY